MRTRRRRGEPAADLRPGWTLEEKRLAEEREAELEGLGEQIEERKQQRTKEEYELLRMKKEVAKMNEKYDKMMQAVANMRMKEGSYIKEYEQRAVTVPEPENPVTAANPMFSSVSKTSTFERDDLNTPISRLIAGADAMDPDFQITHPLNRALPKFAVFLRCSQAHVFNLPGNSTFNPGQDSHAVAEIYGPCPQCAVYDANAAMNCDRKCPFCTEVMTSSPDGRYCCMTRDCWLGCSCIENGTPNAAAVWKEVWRAMGGRYFFVGPKDLVQNIDNDARRAVEAILGPSK